MYYFIKLKNIFFTTLIIILNWKLKKLKFILVFFYLDLL